MSRKQPKVSLISLPGELIPDTALIPNLTLNSKTQALRDHLRLELERAGFAPLDSFAFCTRLLTAFCNDGTVCGLAVCPPGSPMRREKGQRRRVRSAEQPARQRARDPIIILVARMLIADGLLSSNYRGEVQVSAERTLTILAETLENLSRDPEWKSLLTTLPDFRQHRVFELHYETHGYPAYPYFAADLHYGLIARLAQLYGAPTEKWEHALRTTITAPKALIPAIPRDWLPPEGNALNTQQAHAILGQAAERLEGIEPATRVDYVSKFLDLVESGAARRPYRARSVRLTRRHLPYRSSEDFDDSAEQLSHFDALLETAERGLDFDASTEQPANDLATEQALGELAGLDATDKQRQARFIRQRIVLDRNRTIHSPGVIPLHELAAYYVALAATSNATGVVEHWQSLTHFVFLDLLIHTGRSPEWIAAIQVGDTPQMSCRGAPPVFDSAKGVIAYTPDAYPTIPEWLQPPTSSAADAIAAWEFRVRQHDAAYEPISFVYALPLSSIQQSLIGNLIRAKDAALRELKLTARTARELFMGLDDNGVRTWNATDTNHLFHNLTAFVRHLHPAWRAVTAARIANSFEPHYCSMYGLDPVYASYISGRIDDSLARPVHYSHVQLATLSQHYLRAQAEFRHALEREYALTKNATVPSLPWAGLECNLSEIQTDAAYGSWRCPRIEILRRIFKALEQMTTDAEPQTAHNARMTLYAVQLAVSTGLRPFELVGIMRRAVDLKHKRIALTGKPNPAFETHRQVPIPGALLESIQLLIGNWEMRPGSETNEYLFRVFEDGVLIAAQVRHLERVWQEAGTHAGLEKEQVPNLYALRHFFRTHGMNMNYPLPTINALMGHQVAGCELYNPYLENDAKAIMEQGKELAARILVELECGAGRHEEPFRNKC